MRHRKQTEAFSLFSFQDIITSVTGILILLTLFLALQLVQAKTNGTGLNDAVSDEDLKRSVQQVDAQIEQLHKTLDSGHTFLNEFAGLSPTSLVQEESRLKQTLEQLRTEIPQLQSDVAAIESERHKLPSTSDTSSAESNLSVAHHEVEALQRELESLRAANRIVYNVAPDVKKTAWLVDLSGESIRVTKPGVKESSLKFEDEQDTSRIEHFLAWASAREPDSDYFVLLVRPRTLATYRIIYERLNGIGFAIGVDLLERDATLIDLSEVGTSKK